MEECDRNSLTIELLLSYIYSTHFSILTSYISSYSSDQLSSTQSIAQWSDEIHTADCGLFTLVTRYASLVTSFTQYRVEDHDFAVQTS